MSQSAVVP